jgi:hypothetical protein
VTLSQSGVADQIAELQTRSMRIMKFGGRLRIAFRVAAVAFLEPPLTRSIAAHVGAYLVKKPAAKPYTGSTIFQNLPRACRDVGDVGIVYLPPGAESDFRGIV